MIQRVFAQLDIVSLCRCARVSKVRGACAVFSIYFAGASEARLAAPYPHSTGIPWRWTARFGSRSTCLHFSETCVILYSII